MLNFIRNSKIGIILAIVFGLSLFLIRGGNRYSGVFGVGANDIALVGETNISNLLHSIAETITKRGLIILISDLLDNEEDIIKGLRHFRHKGHEVIIFHIIDPKEKNLDFNQNVNFIDIENNEKIMVDSRQIQKKYNNAFEKFCNYYKKRCLQNNIDYTQLITTDSLNKSLTQYLIKRVQIGK